MSDLPADTRTPGQILHDLLYALFHAPQSTVTQDIVDKANAASAAVTAMTTRIDGVVAQQATDEAVLTAHGNELDGITSALRDFANAPGAPAEPAPAPPAAAAPADPAPADTTTAAATGTADTAADPGTAGTATEAA